MYDQPCSQSITCEPEYKVKLQYYAFDAWLFLVHTLNVQKISGDQVNRLVTDKKLSIHSIALLDARLPPPLVFQHVSGVAENFMFGHGIILCICMHILYNFLYLHGTGVTSGAYELRRPQWLLKCNLCQGYIHLLMAYPLQ